MVVGLAITTLIAVAWFVFLIATTPGNEADDMFDHFVERRYREPQTHVKVIDP